MRLAIFFRLDKRCAIPFNYQYILSAWIYSLIGKADRDFAGFLHSEGYAAEAEEDSRRFKFFTFSYLRFPQGSWKPQSSGMEISPCRGIELDLSFYIDQGLEAFVAGLFREQRLRFHPTGAELTVERVETRPVAVSAATVELKTLSPIVVSRLPDPNKGEQQPQYLHPGAPNYAEYFLCNLTGRYHAAALARGLPPADLRGFPTAFELRGPAKEKLITIKPGHASQTRIKAYEYRFALTAPPALTEFGLLAGFGEKGSMGFGCCGALPSPKT